MELQDMSFEPIIAYVVFILSLFSLTCNQSFCPSLPPLPGFEPHVIGLTWEIIQIFLDFFPSNQQTALIKNPVYIPANFEIARLLLANS